MATKTTIFTIFPIINFFEFHRQLAEACKLAANDSGTSSIGSIDSPLSSSFTPHSFIPGLKPSFSANPSHRSLPFLLLD